MIMSSSSVSLRVPLDTIWGANVPARSPGHSHFHRAVAQVDGCGVRPVAVIASLGGANLGFRLAVGMAIAQMCIHFCLKTSVNRSLQQAFDQLAGIISGARQLADQAAELKVFPSASR